MYRQKYASAAIIDGYKRVIISSEYARIGICIPKMALSVESFLDKWESSTIAIRRKIAMQFGIKNIKELDFDRSISDTDNRDNGIKKLDIYVFKITKELQFNISNFSDNPVIFKSLSEIENLQKKKVIDLSWCAAKTLAFLKRDKIIE